MIIQTNQFDVSRILVSSIPSLETCAERYIARLLSVAQSHSLNIVPKEGVDNKKYTSFDTGVSVDVAQVGDQDMLSRMVQFLQRHHNAVLTPLDSSAFTIDLSRSTDVSNGAAAVSSVDYSKAFDEESEAESEDFEFAALTSRHKRNNTFGAESGGGGGGDWGLYSSPSCCEQSVTSASSSMGGDTADGSTEVSENGGLWTDDVANSQSDSESGSDLLDHLMEFYSDED